MSAESDQPLQIDLDEEVDVKFVNGSYRNVCHDLGGGHEVLDKWVLLGELLAHRPGWHFDVESFNETPLWSLGAFGESLLNIHVQPDGSFHVYDHLNDSESSIIVVMEIESWLEEREAGTRQLSPVGRRLMFEDDWWLLRRWVFDVRVTWSDGWFSAAVHELPADASFGRTLQDSVRAAREMIIQFSQAPKELVNHLHVKIGLDEGATTQVMDS